MPPEQIDPALSIFATGTILLSVVACANVIHMRRKGSVLPYEPHPLVPWGPVGCILAMTFLLMTALSAIGGQGDGQADPHTASGLLFAILVELITVAAFVLPIALFTKATPRDLGLPANGRQLVRDVCIGAAACLAALAPVILLQVGLMHLLFRDHNSGHPLIKMLTEAPPTPEVFFLSAVFAVVVAPICEEITFRLLLQGWLERWEDEQLGWRRKVICEPPIRLTPVSDSVGTVALDQPVHVDTPTVVADELSIESDPPQRGVMGLPYGWIPIMVSATAFGLAHFGYGPEPIPLFLLALVLGFLYQRTHRIIPCIVTHALFNLFSMIILWRMLYYHG
jgi:membrane protease YdiL (CAAX protease family)